MRIRFALLSYDVIPNPVARFWRMAVRDLLLRFQDERNVLRLHCGEPVAPVVHGVTNDLQRRVNEHREGVVPGFTKQYKIFRLVHFEIFGDIRMAIAREKEIKGWRREKKLWLVERDNRAWEDLSEKLWPGMHRKRE